MRLLALVALQSGTGGSGQESVLARLERARLEQVPAVHPQRSTLHFPAQVVPRRGQRAVRRFGKERAVALRDLQALRRDGLLGYGRGEVVRTTILFLPGRVRKRRAPVSFPAEETVSPDSRRSRSGDRHVSRFSSHTTDSVVRERSQGAYSPPESYCNIKILNPNATRSEAPAPKSGAGDRRTGFPSCRTDQKTGGPRQVEFFCRFIAPVD